MIALSVLVLGVTITVNTIYPGNSNAINYTFTGSGNNDTTFFNISSVSHNVLNSSFNFFGYISGSSYLDDVKINFSNNPVLFIDGILNGKDVTANNMNGTDSVNFSTSENKTLYFNVFKNSTVNSALMTLTGINNGNGTACGQEQATTSTSCGGLNTGQYDRSDNTNDANWGTSERHTDHDSPGQDWIIYTNYTIPGKSFDLNWTIKYQDPGDGGLWGCSASTVTNSYVIPDTCINQSNSQKVQLQMESYCFTPDTRIDLGNGHYKKIKDVNYNDKVISVNRNGKKEKSKINHIFKHKYDGKIYIINNKIKSTDEHPFYSNGNWVEAKDLKIGDYLINSEFGFEKIYSIKKENYLGYVYNLEVDNNHNYFAEDFLVHNKIRIFCNSAGGMLELYCVNSANSWQKFQTINGWGGDEFRIFEENVTWIIGNFTNNPYLEVGTPDGTQEWNVTGEFFNNSEVTDFSTEINNYLSTCNNDSVGNCQIPLLLHGDTLGGIQATTLEVNYTIDNNNVSFNSQLQNYLDNCETEPSGNCYVYLNVSSDTEGILELTNFNIEMDDTAPVINISLPFEGFNGNTTSSFFINYTANDNDNDTIDYNIYLSTNLTNLSVSLVNSTNNQNQGVVQSYLTDSFVFNTTVYFMINANDGFSSVNSTIRNITINSIITGEATEFNQYPANILINGAGNYTLQYFYALGYLSNSEFNESNLTYTKTLLTDTPFDIFVTNQNTSQVMEATLDGNNVTFTTNLIEQGCDVNMYKIDFNVTALTTTDYLFDCTDTTTGGTCIITMNVTKNFDDFQILDVDFLIPSARLPNWGNRRSIDLTWTNQSAQTINTATGDAVCLPGAGGGGGGGGGLGIQGGGEGSSDLMNQTEGPNGNTTDFIAPLTDNNVTVNPTIGMSESGISLAGVNVGATSQMVMTYTWSTGESSTQNTGTAGGGGTVEVEVLIGDLELTPKAIDIPVIILPFIGKDKGEIKVQSSVTPTECLYETPTLDLSCDINKDTGNVLITYTPDLTKFSDKIDNTLIIKAGTLQDSVPVTFRLFNLRVFFERIKGFFV